MTAKAASDPTHPLKRMQRFFVQNVRAAYDHLIALAAERRTLTLVLMVLFIVPAAVVIILRHRQDWNGRVSQARVWGWRGSWVGFILSSSAISAIHRLCGDLLYNAPWRWDEFISVRNLDAISKSLARGRAVVVVATHTGPWISPLLFQRYGIPAATYSYAGNVARYNRPRQSSMTQRFLSEYTFICTGQERTLLRYLQKPGAVVIYDDIPCPPTKRTLQVDILGLRCHYSTMPFELGTDVVLMSTRRMGFARYDIVFETLPSSLSTCEAMDRYVAMCVAEIEHDLPSCLNVLFPQFMKRKTK